MLLATHLGRRHVENLMFTQDWCCIMQSKNKSWRLQEIMLEVPQGQVESSPPVRRALVFSTNFYSSSLEMLICEKWKFYFCYALVQVSAKLSWDTVEFFSKFK